MIPKKARIIGFICELSGQHEYYFCPKQFYLKKIIGFDLI
jgi:hypothetical protein